MSDIEKNTATNEYDASQIQVLEGLEAVRMRPGMYIGSTSASGLHHLVYEIVDNAIDEALAGYCDKIEVVIEEGDSITVDIEGGILQLNISDEEMQQRRENFVAPAPKHNHGVLAKYAKLVSSADKGAFVE